MQFECLLMPALLPRDRWRFSGVRQRTTDQSAIFVGRHIGQFPEEPDHRPNFREPAVRWPGWHRAEAHAIADDYKQLGIGKLIDHRRQILRPRAHRQGLRALTESRCAMAAGANLLIMLSPEQFLTGERLRSCLVDPPRFAGDGIFEGGVKHECRDRVMRGAGRDDDGSGHYRESGYGGDQKGQGEKRD